MCLLMQFRLQTHKLYCVSFESTTVVGANFVLHTRSLRKIKPIDTIRCLSCHVYPPQTLAGSWQLHPVVPYPEAQLERKTLDRPVVCENTHRQPFIYWFFVSRKLNEVKSIGGRTCSCTLVEDKIFTFSREPLPHHP